MVHYVPKTKFSNTKRGTCDEPKTPKEKKKKDKNNFLNLGVTNESLKCLILKFYFKTVLKHVYENFQKNNLFFEVFIHIDIIKLIDTMNDAGCHITKNFITFTYIFNKVTYTLLNEFLKNFKAKSVEQDIIKYIHIILNNKFFTIILIPINTPIKTDCVFNLAKSHKLENNLYNIIELIDATLIYKEKKTFIYKRFYVRICECSNKYIQEQNIIVRTNELGNVNNKPEDDRCKICFNKEYSEIINKRRYKNFFILTFSFIKIIDNYNNKDEYISINVLYQAIAEKKENFEIGIKYNLIVVPIPNKVIRNSIRGSQVSNLWLLNYRKQKKKKIESSILTLKESTTMSLSTEQLNCLLRTQNLNDMNRIITNILKIPLHSSCLNKICKTTKLTLILICICSNFLKYFKLDSCAYDIYNKVNTNKWMNAPIKGHMLERVRAPHCFFMCLDEIIITELVKFLNYFCNIKLFNVKTDSFSVLLTQKYDILVINMDNLNTPQINTLVELMKNGVYKNKKSSFPISITFWVYIVKPYIRSDEELDKYVQNNLLARFDFLFELSFEKDDDDDVIDEILRNADDDNDNYNEIKNKIFFSELIDKYAYLKKGNLYNYEFVEMSNTTKAIIQKYFNMASDSTTLTIYHIGICELLCISVSILLGKKECLIEHAVLGMFLYDNFVSATKNKLTQFKKEFLNSILNCLDTKYNSLQKLMNYFSTYLNAKKDT
ncbi:conserved protein, unknown function [Hepatocystis sp. ex Piliocolobus tephrosceles]|nr:conserved protein, unknown function [Hepatocystis sp. ex Piliocolobus tephrosceles]